MNDLISRIAIALNPIIALLLILAGATVANHFSPGFAAVAVGAVIGLALAIPLCGTIGLLSSINRNTERMADELMCIAVGGQGPNTARQVGQPGQVASPVARAQGHAMPSSAPAPRASQSSPAASHSPALASNGGEAPQEAEATPESEHEMLERGHFAQYHLAKAKRLMAVGNYREAASQAAASLAHEHTAEARAVRSEARRRG